MIRTDYSTNPTITTRSLPQPANYRWLEDKDKAEVDYTLEFKQIRKNCEVKERRRSPTGVITDTEVAGSFAFANGSGADYYYLAFNKVKSRVAKLTGATSTHYPQMTALKFPPKTVAIILRPPPVIEKASRHTYGGYVKTKGYWLGSPKLTRSDNGLTRLTVEASTTRTETATLYIPTLVWGRTWNMTAENFIRRYEVDTHGLMVEGTTESLRDWAYPANRYDAVEPIMVKADITHNIGYDGEITLTASMLRPDETLSGLKGTRKMTPTSDITLHEELAQAVYHPDRLFGKEEERDAEGLGGMNKAYPGWDDAMNGIVGYGSA